MQSASSLQVVNSNTWRRQVGGAPIPSNPLWTPLRQIEGILKLEALLKIVTLNAREGSQLHKTKMLRSAQHDAFNTLDRPLFADL